jgi:Leucine-rich repeat (LRR) protein
LGCPQYFYLHNNNIFGHVDFNNPSHQNFDCRVAHMSLANNSITSIGVLHNLQQLEYLDLRGNKIESHFLNPKDTTGYTKLKKCFLGSEINHFCVDDLNQVPDVCGDIEKW